VSNFWNKNVPIYDIGNGSRIVVEQPKISPVKRIFKNCPQEFIFSFGGKYLLIMFKSSFTISIEN
jgi:hypothetical protein